jgi:hypothetical protein
MKRMNFLGLDGIIAELSEKGRTIHEMRISKVDDICQNHVKLRTWLMTNNRFEDIFHLHALLLEQEFKINEDAKLF